MEKVRPQVKGKEIYLEIMRRKIEKSNQNVEEDLHDADHDGY